MLLRFLDLIFGRSLVRHQTTLRKALSAERQFVGLNSYGGDAVKGSSRPSFGARASRGGRQHVGRLTINVDDFHLILDIFSTKSMGQAISEARRSDTVVSGLLS